MHRHLEASKSNDRLRAILALLNNEYINSGKIDLYNLYTKLVTNLLHSSSRSINAALCCAYQEIVDEIQYISLTAWEYLLVLIFLH